LKPLDFFYGSQWNPEVQMGNMECAFAGKHRTVLGAMLIAVPLGIFTATFFLSGVSRIKAF
jgi:ABC-type phosphate transport system permease subunit